MSELKKLLEKNPKGTITLMQAMEILKEKSNISKMALRTAAIRDGFKSEHIGIGREKVLIDSVKFKDWIKSSYPVISAGFKTVSIAAKELNITSAYVYKLIQDKNLKIKVIGSGRGKVYVDFPALQKIFN